MARELPYVSVMGDAFADGIPLKDLVSCGNPRLVPEYRNGKVFCGAD